MTASLPGDQARATVRVDVPRPEAFRIFTEEIDQWWRRGRRFRHAGKRRGILVIEPRLGGRIYESFETSKGTKVFESGRITRWEPPERLCFEWRLSNFAKDEKTFVEIRFEERAKGTLVTVVHSGWSGLRSDHPVRHGEDVAVFIGTMGRWWGDLLSVLRVYAATAAEERPGA